MSRKLSDLERRAATLARLAALANIQPSSVNGYVVVYARDDEIVDVITNAIDEATTIYVLARAIAHRSRAIREKEDRLAAQ